MSTVSSSATGVTTGKAESTARLALFITLATETVFFLTLLVAYVALRGQENWPVDHSLSRLGIPILNTGILLVSTLTAAQAHLSIRKGNIAGLQNWLIITLLLGLLFVAGQAYDFNHAGLKIDDQTFGGVFFTLMGFHAVHVLAGVVLLIINTVRCRLGDFTRERHIAVQMGTWFWYYVAAVWVVLFAALYLV